MKKLVKRALLIGSPALLIGSALFFGKLTYDFADYTDKLYFMPDSLEKKPTPYFDLPGEDTLKLDQFVLPKNDEEKEKKLFKERISGIDTCISQLAEEVDTFDVYHLYEYAHGLHQLFEPKKKFITMLKIHFGRDEDTGRIILLYQPTYFIHDRKLPNDIVKYAAAALHPPMYRLVECGLELVKLKDAEKMINNYKDEIKIRNGRIDLMRGFNHNGDKPAKDVEDVSFTFQEMFALMRDNPKSKNPKINNSITVMNIAKGPTIEGKEHYIKHSLILSNQISISAKPAEPCGDTQGGKSKTSQESGPLNGVSGNFGNHNPPDDARYQQEHNESSHGQLPAKP